jgi:hypothetical protein
MTTNFQSRAAAEAEEADLDKVAIHFDWLIPAHADEALTFILNVKRGNRESLGAASRFSG